mgnify:FL=1|tara:strand:- start:596 stop:1189 length:594 start_codon:yes stop_codon:yes gene_type:complete
MADKTSFRELSQSIQHISYLREMPDVDDDERGQMKQYMEDLVHRQADKLDAIIDLLKECDRRVDVLDKELQEIKDARDSWKKKKEQIAGIIKFCYQQNLIESKLNGNKYQATIANNSPKVQEDMDLWNTIDKERYGLTKTTTVVRNSDGTVISQKEEVSADKDRLKTDLQQKLPGTPASAQLLQVVRLSYGRRKRIS